MASLHIAPENFESEILNSKGLVIVDFFAVWCGPCKMLAPIFEKASEILKDSAKFIKFDIDTDTERVVSLGITTVPTIVIFKDGIEVDRKIGLCNVTDLESAINKYL